MRHSLAISAVALAVVAFATPGEAQTFNRNGGNQPQRSFGNVPQNSGFTQRSIQGSSTQNSNVGNRTFRSVQPPAPGNQAGNQTGNARSFSIQPPPSGGAQRSAQPPIGNSIRPPIASPTIPTATATAATVGAATAATAAVATSSRAQQGAAGNDTAQVGQPIDPTATSSVSVPTSATAQVGQPTGAATNSDLPPLEMLASVGEPIMPLNQAPTATVASATQAGQVIEGRFVRTGAAVAVEQCTVPTHHVTYHRVYRRW